MRAGGVGIGPVSSGGVVGIIAGMCLLVMIAGLLLGMRYHRQNRDRLIDLDALVRQFALGSEGTHPSPHTPGGRMVAVTPSSMYNNAAFQHRSRDIDSSGFLGVHDSSRGPSSSGTGTGGPQSQRPFGSVTGLRDSPPAARRKIRPPAPGHVPMAPGDAAGPSSGGRRGDLGSRPLAEDRSLTHVSAQMVLDAFGSVSEALKSGSTAGGGLGSSAGGSARAAGERAGGGGGGNGATGATRWTPTACA